MTTKPQKPEVYDFYLLESLCFEHTHHLTPSVGVSDPEIGSNPRADLRLP